jgi:ubiquinone/menaquinone biosynthesis C-methylase UbiE
VATAYANRDDDAERRTVWPLLADAVRPAEPTRISGRPDGTVLELGCGLGALAQTLADEHWLRVYAVDISPTMHRLGATRFRDAWILRTLPDRRGRLPLRRAQCTGAVVQRVLLHLPHPCLIIGLMTEARRVLRPGAPLAIVETDTRDGHRHGNGDTPPRTEGEPYTEYYHLRDGTTLPTTAWRHSPTTIVNCLTSAGFTVDEIRQVSPLPDPLLLYLARAA